MITAQRLTALPAAFVAPPPLFGRHTAVPVHPARVPLRLSVLSEVINRPRVAPRPVASTEVAITPVLQHQTYAHGAYMGLARSLLHSAPWNAALSALMPQVHEQATFYLRANKTAALMALLENNPVLAAYGASRARAHPVPVEWDVWLDASCPADLEQTKIIHGNNAALVLGGHDPSGAQVQALLSGAVCGSDLHTGLSPRNWLSLYSQAQRLAPVPGPPTPSALVLDIKSAWSSAADVQSFMIALQSLGVPVIAAGSFNYEQVGGLKTSRPLLFVHGISGIARALRTRKLPAGTGVLLNGGTLLNSLSEGGWQVQSQHLQALAALQRQGSLELGIYIQEASADPQAVAALSACANANPTLFSLGFAYGGLPGRAECALPHGAGMGMQRLLALADSWLTTSGSTAQQIVNTP